MINKQGKIFGKVSVIDLFVLTVLAAIVLFGVFRVGNPAGIGIRQAPSQITMGLTIEYVENFTARRLRIGDPVAADFSNAELGTIIAISRETATEQNPNSDGILITSPKEGYTRVEITTTLTGYPVENGIWVMGHLFFVGESLIVRAGETNMYMTVSEIRVE